MFRIAEILVLLGAIGSVAWALFAFRERVKRRRNHDAWVARRAEEDRIWNESLARHSDDNSPE